MRSLNTLTLAEVPVTTTPFESTFGGQVHITETAGQGTRVVYGNGLGRANEPDLLRAITLITGRPTLSVRASGNRNPAPAFSRHERTHIETAEPLSVPRYSIAEAAMLLTAVNRADKPVDAIFQSQSAIAGVVAAYEQPEAFEDIVLAYPAGISGHRPTLLEAVKRAVLDRKAWSRHRPDMADNIHSKRSVAEKARAIAHGLHPVARLRSAHPIRSALLAPMLHEIKQRPNAPGITLFLGLDDHIFRVEECLQSLTSSTDVDQIVIAPGSHSISGRPEILQLALEQLNVTKEMRARGIDTTALPLRNRIHFPPGIDSARKVKILQLVDELDARSFALQE